MLVKRAWSELHQGDRIYLPRLKLQSVVIDPGPEKPVVQNFPGHGELSGAPFWQVMRWEGDYSYRVSEYGVETGEVQWARVRDVTASP